MPVVQGGQQQARGQDRQARCEEGQAGGEGSGSCPGKQERADTRRQHHAEEPGLALGFQKAEGKAQIGIQAREEPGGSRQQGQAGRLRRERTMAEEDENEGIEAIEQRQKKEPEQQMGQYQGSHAAGKMQGDAEALVTHFRQELEAQGITTGQFIEMVVTKYFTKSKEGENNMATRTIAFQVSEELYQRIKDYLKHYEETYGRKLSQKDFMVQLIEAELDAVDEEAEAAAAQKQDPSAEMNETVGEDPAEDPAESDDEDEPDVDQENNDPDEDSDTDEETNTEEAPDEATDGESEYGESGDAYTEE